MKSTLFLAIVGLILTSCRTAKQSSVNYLKGNWQLSIFPASETDFDQSFGDQRPEIEVKTSRHVVKGTTGCSRFRVSYTLQNKAIRFNDDLKERKRRCLPNQPFLKSFQMVNRYQAGTNQLRFLHDSTLIMVFSRKK